MDYTVRLNKMNLTLLDHSLYEKYTGKRHHAWDKRNSRERIHGVRSYTSV